ncbi:hypothetical protein EGH22_04610 [Halomicroarcula sp. F28]|uniref:DUF7286 family protein n=1 Tax=Haloarcula salinisoli TaxID=2487746 RepID=UPI001C7388A4|nr:hypothetical protein [Halomicroarcula salinisoli]MBX0285596.1 hypothetical protein [Halomicroarcula salinisoli]
MTGPRDDFLEDTRARIPFSLIALLLLVTSQSVVFVLATREDGNVDRDPQLAMERTEDATQTALASAVREATIKAGRAPVLEAAGTQYGDVLVPPGETRGSVDSDTVFERYVKLLIYMEASERLPQTNQTIRGETRTNVSLDPVESPSDARAAIDSVSLYVGNMSYGEATSGSVGYGNVKVALEGVSIRMTREGDVLETGTREINTTVATPLFDLHNRTQEYERQLNMDFRDGAESAPNPEGLGDYTAMYAYPFVYTRAQAQSLGEPHARILAPRHLEVLANEGIYHTQRRVFGSDDRFSEQLLTRGWGRALAEDQRRGYETVNGTSTSVDRVMDSITDNGFRSGSNYIYEDIGTNAQALRDEPDWESIVRREDHLGTNHTLSLEQEAKTVYGNLTRDGGIDTAIDRVYEVDVGRDVDVDEQAIVGNPDADFQSLEARNVDVSNIERVVDPEANTSKVDYYLIELAFQGWFRDGDDELHKVTYNVDLTVHGEHGPDTLVEQKGIGYDYETGPRNAWYDTNIQEDNDGDDIPRKAVVELLPGVSNFDSIDSVESQLEAHISSETQDSNSVTEPEDLIEIIADDSATVQAAPEDREELRGQIAADLREFTNETGDVSTTVTRRELLSGTASNTDPFTEGHGESPLRNLSRQLGDRSWVYGIVDGSYYESAPEKVRAEVRKYFVDRLQTRLNETSRKHETAMSRLDEQVERPSGTSLFSATTAAKPWLTSGPVDTTATYHPGVGTAVRGTVGPDLLEGTYITPNAAPNYMTFDTLDISTVPATGSPSAGYYPAAYNSNQLYASPYEGHPYRSGVELRVAAEVLSAGKAADPLVSDPDWDSGSVSDLNASLAAQRDAIVAHAGTEAAQPFSGIEASNVTRALSNELARYGSTERQVAVLARSDAALSEIAENTSETFDRPDPLQYAYLDRSFQEHLASSIRFGIEDAVRGTGTGLSDGRVTGRTAQETRQLGRALRTELNESTLRIHEQRAEQAGDDLGNTTTVAGADDWLESDLNAPLSNASELDPGYAETQWEAAPGGTPSGMLLPGVPGWHELRTNVWQFTLAGTYPRFTVTASAGTTQDAPAAEYVREDANVSVEIAGRERRLGRSTSISFESKVSIVAAVPGDRLGIGGKAGKADHCSDSWDTVGPVRDSSNLNGC